MSQTSMDSAASVSSNRLVSPKRTLSRFNWLLTFIVSALVCMEALLARAAHLNGLGQLATSLPGLPGVVLMCVLHGYSRWRRFPRFVEATGLAIWAGLLTCLLGLLMQIAGRTSSPLQDSALANIDARIHVSTGAIVRFAGHFPALRLSSDVAYALLMPLIIAALLLPPLLGNAQASRRYVLSIVVAALLTAGLFALCPAVGPWTVYGFAPTQDQAAVESYLRLLKSAGPVRLNPAASAIVSFPSFHVVLAILSTIALWGVRRARPLLWVLTIAICASTLTTGWHYAVDVIGGLFVTLIAHLIAVRVMGMLEPEAVH